MEQSQPQEKGFVIAQISDLYSPWVGTRELLLRRAQPLGAGGKP
jgi:hypothetical protein